MTDRSEKTTEVLEPIQLPEEPRTVTKRECHSLVLDVDEREGFASWLEAVADMIRRHGKVRLAASVMECDKSKG